MSRDPLPQRRICETFHFSHQNHSYIATIGFYPDGRPGEIFLDAGRSGTDIQNHARDAAVLASLAFQHGCSVETLRHAMTRNPDGSASGPIGVLLDDLAREGRG